MKLTQPKRVMDIVRPSFIGLPEQPSVEMSVLLVQAVEQMLKENLTSIAVLGRGRIVGHIRLCDALKHLGLP